MSKKVAVIFILILSQIININAKTGPLRLCNLIDIPVAQITPAAVIETELRMYPEGGLLTSIMVGISSNFSIGAAYGGQNIIGEGRIDLNPQPSVHLRYLLIKERFLIPAFLIGFNSQGLGRYYKGLKRYAIKSPGLYIVASKNTSFLGGLGLHGGICFSLENGDGDSDPDLFIGCHKYISTSIVLLVEYDFALNDNGARSIGDGKGYLNSGMRWSVAKNFFIEFSWKNILQNKKNIAASSREVKLVYRHHL